MPTSMEIAAYGWQSPAWNGFYPDDIPDDWRLDYYANEFYAVVVPWAAWRRADDEVLLGWQGQVPDGFLFYWELPPGEEVAGERLQRLRGGDEFAAHWGGTLTLSESLQIERAMELRPLRAAIEEGRGRGLSLVVVMASAAESLRPARDIALLLGGG